ncbi:unnamed protein product [Peniophora sp. CBMAI 1063]|nr:unnamed protein product [Peniophora sp. CBMAI 1063]
MAASSKHREAVAVRRITTCLDDIQCIAKDRKGLLAPGNVHFYFVFFVAEMNAAKDVTRKHPKFAPWHTKMMEPAANGWSDELMVEYFLGSNPFTVDVRYDEWLSNANGPIQWWHALGYTKHVKETITRFHITQALDAKREREEREAEEEKAAEEKKKQEEEEEEKKRKEIARRAKLQALEREMARLKADSDMELDAEDSHGQDDTTAAAAAPQEHVSAEGSDYTPESPTPTRKPSARPTPATTAPSAPLALSAPSAPSASLAPSAPRERLPSNPQATAPKKKSPSSKKYSSSIWLRPSSVTGQNVKFDADHTHIKIMEHAEKLPESEYLDDTEVWSHVGVHGLDPEKVLLIKTSCNRCKTYGLIFYFRGTPTCLPCYFGHGKCNNATLPDLPDSKEMADYNANRNVRVETINWFIECKFIAQDTWQKWFDVNWNRLVTGNASADPELLPPPPGAAPRSKAGPTTVQHSVQPGAPATPAQQEAQPEQRSPMLDDIPLDLPLDDLVDGPSSLEMEPIDVDAADIMPKQTSLKRGCSDSVQEGGETSAQLHPPKRMDKGKGRAPPEDVTEAPDTLGDDAPPLPSAIAAAQALNKGVRIVEPSPLEPTPSSNPVPATFRPPAATTTRQIPRAGVDEFTRSSVAPSTMSTSVDVQVPASASAEPPRVPSALHPASVPTRFAQTKSELREVVADLNSARKTLAETHKQTAQMMEGTRHFVAASVEHLKTVREAAKMDNVLQLVLNGQEIMMAKLEWLEKAQQRMEEHVFPNSPPTPAVAPKHFLHDVLEKKYPAQGTGALPQPMTNWPTTLTQGTSLKVALVALVTQNPAAGSSTCLTTSTSSVGVVTTPSTAPSSTPVAAKPATSSAPKPPTSAAPHVPAYAAPTPPGTLRPSAPSLPKPAQATNAPPPAPSSSTTSMAPASAAPTVGHTCMASAPVPVMTGPRTHIARSVSMLPGGVSMPPSATDVLKQALRTVVVSVVSRTPGYCRASMVD